MKIEPVQIHCYHGPLDGQVFMVDQPSLTYWIVAGDGESQRMVLYYQERRYRLGGKIVVEYVPTDDAPVLSVQTSADGVAWLRPPDIDVTP